MRWFVGLLLASASVLKAVQLFTEPAATLVNPLGYWFLPMQIGVELGVGLFVLSGVYWRTLRPLTILLFTGFAGYSLYLAMSGAASCGCFGPVRIHPWWTFFLDSAVVVGLLISERSGRVTNIDSDPAAERLVCCVAGRRKLIAAIMGTSIAAIALLMRYVDRQSAVAGSGLAMVGGVTVLEPEQWIGKPLPIADFIDLDLSSGQWIVLLHRHDCPVCQEEMPRYEQLAMQTFDRQIALVEVPPYAESDAPANNACHYARLKDDREWFVQTPVEIQLQHGLVTASKTHGHETSR